MNLANEVSALASEAESLRASVQILTQANAAYEAENRSLKDQLAKALADRDYHMTTKAELKTLLDRTGADLVAGIQKFHKDCGEQLQGTKIPSVTYSETKTNGKNKAQANDGSVPQVQ